MADKSDEDQKRDEVLTRLLKTPPTPKAAKKPAGGERGPVPEKTPEDGG